MCHWWHLFLLSYVTNYSVYFVNSSSSYICQKRLKVKILLSMYHDFSLSNEYFILDVKCF